MEGQDLKEGKERVRQNLIAPLERVGMVRKRGTSVEKHDAFLARLQARLSYMTADRLQDLVEVIERYAEGPKKNQWPAEVSIMNWARALQEPPASESRLVRSYLQSGAGDAAAAGDYLVELFGHLKRFGAPPNDYSLKCIKEAADGNRRRRAQIERDRDHGQAGAADMAWLASYMDARRRCLDIRAKQKGAAA